MQPVRFSEHIRISRHPAQGLQCGPSQKGCRPDQIQPANGKATRRLRILRPVVGRRKRDRQRATESDLRPIAVHPSAFAGPADHAQSGEARTRRQIRFRICAKCGRSLEPDETRHKYPSHVPPHRGQKRGPRAGWQCPNSKGEAQYVHLVHQFTSQAITIAAGPAPGPGPGVHRTRWQSGMALIRDTHQEAASRHLQIVPEEIQAGVRPIKITTAAYRGRSSSTTTVPGGAGYARAISDNLKDIAEIALAIGRRCTNDACRDACYHCLLSYSNQRHHHFLDRNLGTAMLEFLLNGTRPDIGMTDTNDILVRIGDFLPPKWRIRDPISETAVTFETESQT